MSLQWVSTRQLRHFKHRSASVQVVLYSSQRCAICQLKMVPLFLELAAWPEERWWAHGYRANAWLQFSAIDTTSNPRPTQSESRDVRRVPCVQMWAPAHNGYAPKLYCERASKQLGFLELRRSLVSWIVEHANSI